jgi:hypothetical protein
LLSIGKPLSEFWKFNPGKDRRVRAVNLFFCLLLVTAACSDLPASSPLLTGALPIDAPKSAQAGEQLEITIGPVQAANGTPIGLVMVGLHGPRIYHTTISSGLARFVIPAQDTLQPGYLAFVAAVDEARGKAGVMLFLDHPYALVDSRSQPDNSKTVSPVHLG